jgi:hypothetical protein
MSCRGVVARINISPMLRVFMFSGLARESRYGTSKNAVHAIFLDGKAKTRFCLAAIFNHLL